MPIIASQWPLALRLLLSATLATVIMAAAQQARAETPPEAMRVAEQAAPPLTEAELDILVARIALYPDELVALISAASLYPLQIVEAQRFLDQRATNKDLQPKASWDGSIISLLNYPEIVKMMSDDLNWTQLFGEAILSQQDDVLGAIQQLREEAVAKGVIKSDDKIKVSEESETGQQNIVIQPASSEVIYVPQYDPAMLYEPGYAYRPIGYYPYPYPYYWNPAATFFAGAVTGAIWAATVDWNDGFWGGPWYWNNGWGSNNVDIDIDCKGCIIGSDFSGKLNINDVDWRRIDRSKINFDKSAFNKIPKKDIAGTLKATDRNKLTNKAGPIKAGRPSSLPGKGTINADDIRRSTLDKMKKQPVRDFTPSTKMTQSGNKLQPPDLKPGQLDLDRPVGKPKPGLAPENRPRTPSPLGEVTRGRDADIQSLRGNKSMGGGMKRDAIGGSGPKKLPKHKMGGSGRGRHR
ncbi:DUF3300 domain-containing protein [Aestuariivirga sp.]|jgi:hypothetical protein|uniref:DUF3300 domain-containing protein n=1 Tax=Aestuariivirga sp. TaxID=2650926 RepID=UPI003784FCC9